MEKRSFNRWKSSQVKNANIVRLWQKKVFNVFSRLVKLPNYKSKILCNKACFSALINHRIEYKIFQTYFQRYKTIICYPCNKRKRYSYYFTHITLLMSVQNYHSIQHRNIIIFKQILSRWYLMQNFVITKIIKMWNWFFLKYKFEWSNYLEIFNCRKVNDA